jgi:threonine synthase
MSARVPGIEGDSPNPFIRYRWLLDSYRKAIGQGWSDADFVALVDRLDKAVAAVWGKGFELTPLSRQPDLAAAAALPTDLLWVKDETSNVGGSHKARHLFGVLLHMEVDEETDGDLAIASCGNAAVAAAVVARAAERPLRVFIPTWADPAVVNALRALEATIEVSERKKGEIGDPTVRRMLEAVERGAVPFSVQGTITPDTLDGGRTIGWELAEQLSRARVAGRVALFVQVGGGALAASTWRGLRDGIHQQWLDVDPILHTVQTEAAAPLNRAWRGLLSEMDRQPLLDHDDAIDLALGAAREDPDHFMWAWEEIGSTAATGIVDDVTYDWLPVVEAMLRSEGQAKVVSEEMITRANHLARIHTGIEVGHTGSAGLAGMLDPSLTEFLDRGQNVVVFFTGTDRHDR